jgi:hypothetical protein
MFQKQGTNVSGAELSAFIATHQCRLSGVAVQFFLYL